MTETTTNNPLTEKESKITYEQFGKEQAENAKGDPEQLKESLPILYHKIVEEAKLDKASVSKKIENLQKEIVDLENRKHNLNASKSSMEDEIINSEKQIDDIENNKGHSEIVPFVIAAFITLLLTFYLWAFYAASGYAALNGIKSGSTGFAGIFGALSDAFNKGGFVVVITVLFPVVFLGLGFLIHDALEKKSYGIITALLLFTFCFDAIIGYQISHHIYMNSYNTGETEIPWNGKYIFEDINFYLVLASGFVCYVMWGFLLNYTLNKQKEIQPDIRIQKLKRKTSELKAEIQKCIAEINVCNNNIEKSKKNISNYQEGKVIVNITKLRSNIGEFFGGWGWWVSGMRTTEASTLMARATIIKDEWLNNKISTLEED